MKELWDRRYADEVYVYGIEPNDYFKERIKEITKGRILLPADGEGRNSVYAASLGWNAFAFDISDSGQNKALKLADSQGVSIQYNVSDLVDYDFGEEIYDAIGLFFFHVPDGLRKYLHYKAVKALKPGGFVILEAFHKKQIHLQSGGPSNPEWLFSRKMLQEDFQDLEIMELERVSRELSEGTFHKGMAEMVRLFARKPDKTA